MRYPKDQKERTRRFIVETASRVLRRDGIEAVKIVPLMAEAGMTQGAFYKSFETRDALIEAALLLAAEQTKEFAVQWAAAGRAAAEHPLARIIDEYLSERHLNDRERGCPLAALGSELWRQPEPIRRSMYRAFAEMAGVLGADLPAGKQHLARPLYMFLASTICCARLASARPEQLSVLEDGRATARRLVEL